MKFEEEPIKKEIKDALKKMNISVATEIQKRCIPLILEGKDVVGQSLTGSGKTAAFAIPIIEKNIDGSTNALILTPTRELAGQVSDMIFSISGFLKLNICTVYGGVDIRPQINKLKNANIIIATPGRLLDHINRGTINLTNIKTLVLDEADQMLDMGFVNDIEKIISKLPQKKQTLLFSATFSPKINSLIKKHLNNPVFIKAQEFVDETKLKQVYYNISIEKRFSLLAHLLKNDNTDLSIVFCNKRYEVDKVKNNLKKQGVKSVGIHGGLTQSKRQLSLKLLKKEHANVLVATDVAARGLDINGISHVYNYGIPRNPEDYTHRIGRTARMGRDGLAVSLVTERDRKEFGAISKEHKINRLDLPSFEQIKFQKNLPSEEYFEAFSSKKRDRSFKGRKERDRFNNKKENRGNKGRKKSFFKDEENDNYSGKRKNNFRNSHNKKTFDRNNKDKKTFDRNSKDKKTFDRNNKDKKRKFENKNDDSRSKNNNNNNNNNNNKNNKNPNSKKKFSKSKFNSKNKNNENPLNSKKEFYKKIKKFKKKNRN